MADDLVIAEGKTTSANSSTQTATTASETAIATATETPPPPVAPAEAEAATTPEGVKEKTQKSFLNPWWGEGTADPACTQRWVTQQVRARWGTLAAARRGFSEAGEGVAEGSCVEVEVKARVLRRLRAGHGGVEKLRWSVSDLRQRRRTNTLEARALWLGLLNRRRR